MNELWTQLTERRNKFLNWLEFNINDEKVLNAAIDYFELEEKVRDATIKMAQIDLAASKSIELDNKNIENVIAIYNLDKCFNEEKANKWLSKALKLVLIDNHTFDGLKFDNGKAKYLKTEITR